MVAQQATMSSRRVVAQRRRLAYALLVGTVLVSTSAIAQQTPATAPAAAQTGGGDNQLQEIVVTAQRREQNLQDTPVAVSAFNRAQLQASGVSTVKDLTQVDASLSVDYAAGVYLPFLRGIGNDAAGNVGDESSVAVYIDDVYYSRLSAAYLALGDIDRVEVLNGPQGTLFGRNSSGGAVQMFTRDPGRRTELDATVGYANYDTVSGQFYASTPITDNLFFNIAAAGSSQGSGWGKDITTGQDVYLEGFGTIRSKLIWEPTSKTTIKIVGFYAYQKGDIGVDSDRAEGTYGSTPMVPLPGYPNPPQRLPSLADSGRFYDTLLNLRDFQREQGFGGSIRVDQDIGFADLVSISAVRTSIGDSLNADFSPQNFENAELRDTDRQITQELQVKSKRGNLINWIVGAYYLNSRAGYDPASIFGDALSLTPLGAGASENVFGLQKISSYSLYGQATAPLGHDTNFTAGLRFTDDDVDGLGQTTATIPGLGSIPIAPDFRDNKTFQAATWKFSLDHHFTRDFMVYISDSRGFKSGTFNTLPLDTAPALPETVDTYEIGAKSELFDRRIRLNGALFWNQIKDPQVLTIIETGLTQGIGITNAQEARVRGAELGLEAVVTQGLRFRGGFTYLDDRYTKFINAPFYAENGFTLTGPILGNATGNSLADVPAWRANVGANYTLNTGVGDWVADVSAAYTGRFAWTADNQVFQKPVTLLNASLNFTPSTASWVTLSVWGKNLTDEKYYSSVQETAGLAGTGGDTAAPSPPLTFGGSVSVKY